MTETKVVVKKPNNVTDTEDFDKLVDKSHPNIVRVFELFSSPVETYVVMEFCAGGDLFGAMDHCFANFGTMTFNFIAGVMQQVIRGVNYIHCDLGANYGVGRREIYWANPPSSPHHYISLSLLGTALR